MVERIDRKLGGSAQSFPQRIGSVLGTVEFYSSFLKEKLLTSSINILTTRQDATTKKEKWTVRIRHPFTGSCDNDGKERYTGHNATSKTIAVEEVQATLSTCGKCGTQYVAD